MTRIMARDSELVCTVDLAMERPDSTVVPGEGMDGAGGRNPGDDATRRGQLRASSGEGDATSTGGEDGAGGGERRRKGRRRVWGAISSHHPKSQCFFTRVTFFLGQ
jgi:hypothetical protein